MDQDCFNDSEIVRNGLQRITEDRKTVLLNDSIGIRKVLEGGNVKFNRNGVDIKVEKINRPNVQPTIDTVLQTVSEWFSVDQDKMKDVLFTTGSTPEFGKPGKKEKSGDLDFSFDNNGLIQIINDRNIQFDFMSEEAEGEIDKKKLFRYLAQKSDESGFATQTIGPEIHVAWPIVSGDDTGKNQDGKFVQVDFQLSFAKEYTKWSQFTPENPTIKGGVRTVFINTLVKLRKDNNANLRTYIRKTQNMVDGLDEFRLQRPVEDQYVSDIIRGVSRQERSYIPSRSKPQDFDTDGNYIGKLNSTPTDKKMLTGYQTDPNKIISWLFQKDGKPLVDGIGDENTQSMDGLWDLFERSDMWKYRSSVIVACANTIFDSGYSIGEGNGFDIQESWWQKWMNALGDNQEIKDVLNLKRKLYTQLGLDDVAKVIPQGAQIRVVIGSYVKLNDNDNNVSQQYMDLSSMPDIIEDEDRKIMMSNPNKKYVIIYSYAGRTTQKNQDKNTNVKILQNIIDAGDLKGVIGDLKITSDKNARGFAYVMIDPGTVRQ